MIPQLYINYRLKSVSKTPIQKDMILMIDSFI
jgi:hypothetical protein